jgi:D-serine deaminase-like pyridoxal phosphate-dependent protein
MSVRASTAATDPRDLIGRPVASLSEPVLILDGDALDRNLRAMSAWAKGRVLLRPHAKTHRSAAIGRLQRELGAAGLTVATVRDGLRLARSGLDSILVARQIPAGQDLAGLAAAARGTEIIVVADSPAAVDALALAAGRAGSHFGVLVDIDLGMHRSGVTTQRAALRLGAAVASRSALRLRGLMGYEGHVVLDPEPRRRAASAARAMRRLADYVAAFERAGLSTEIVSAGATSTCETTGASPRVTEVQPGSYALMDAGYARLAGAFEPALGIACTVVARHGEAAVVNCGRRQFGLAFLRESQSAGGGALIRSVGQDQTIVEFAGGRGPAAGDRVYLHVSDVSSASAETWHYVVARGGPREGTVAEIWPTIQAGDRFPGRGGPVRG